MALRILPYRSYDEHDVYNGFRVRDEDINNSTTGSGNGDAGVFMTVANGDLDQEPVSYGTDNYLGKTDYPNIGSELFPKVNLELKPAVDGDAFLGLTLRQTADYDENGEKFLYYRQKAEELQVTLRGQAVPVVNKGMFTLHSSAFEGGVVPPVGSGIQLSTTESGTATTCLPNAGNKIGIVIGAGTRNAAGNRAQYPDQFSGSYAQIILG